MKAELSEVSTDRNILLDNLDDVLAMVEQDWEPADRQQLYDLMDYLIQKDANNGLFSEASREKQTESLSNWSESQ